MDMHKEDLDLAAELEALRPSPRRTFITKLDERMAAGFPRRAGTAGTVLGRLSSRLRTLSPRRMLVPAAAVAVLAIAATTAVIAIGPSGDGVSSRQLVDGGRTGARLAPREHSSTQFSDVPPTVGAPTGRLNQADSAAGASGEIQSTGAGGVKPYSVAPTTRHRSVERDAELVLHTQPKQFGQATRRVFSAVHAANGIVLSSSIHDRTGGGGADQASADFELLVPSARLGDTLASLSQIANVRSRHESTRDITAPTVGVGERLQDTEARVEGLLAQLASAESEGERTAIEAELRRERQRAAVLRSRLDRLRHRARFAHVSLRIESGNTSGAAGPGRWGAGDALDDAGRILAIAAGVTVIGVAVMAPLALIALLAWLASRTLVRRRRESALG